MAQKRDYYEVLGVPKGSDDATLKKAYRKVAKEFHPDLNPGNAEAEAKFKEANEAFEVLSDGEKRARYDQFGHAGVDPNFGGGGGYGGGGFGGFGDMGDIDLGDLFGSFFGGGGGQRRNGPQKGESIRTSQTITFEEAAFGCEKEVTVTRTESCDQCYGTGCSDGSQPETCPECRGSGTVRIQRGQGGFSFTTTAACSRCRGRGKLIQKPCGTCSGSGEHRRKKTLSVNIPAGIDDNQTVSLRGQGGTGKNGGPAGDLLITVSVIDHKFFQREGTSVYLEQAISFEQAVFGSELILPTIDGDVKYSMPAGTQTGTTFRLRGKGIPAVNGRGRGDQFVVVKVMVPTDLTREQKYALQEYAKTMTTSEEDSEKSKGLFDKKKKKK